jgi:hypothetical protein
MLVSQEKNGKIKLWIFPAGYNHADPDQKLKQIFAVAPLKKTNFF